MSKPHEIAIAELLKELDNDHAEYQRLHRKFYLEEDKKAKLIYVHLSNLLKRVIERIEFYERK